ncbi:uncharacterized protein LOC133795011 [Humulus lupulus]|uniref:uncharacterized protein LOC133795011 n=1 Tax=Humulus lupulus TaxID=3486 RepID=UPI002B40878D|nr:uncharacterized protein LOC133795011 [Humulus lupulus]
MESRRDAQIEVVFVDGAAGCFWLGFTEFHLLFSCACGFSGSLFFVFQEWLKTKSDSSSRHPSTSLIASATPGLGGDDPQKTSSSAHSSPKPSSLKEVSASRYDDSGGAKPSTEVSPQVSSPPSSASKKLSAHRSDKRSKRGVAISTPLAACLKENPPSVSITKFEGGDKSDSEVESDPSKGLNTGTQPEEEETPYMDSENVFDIYSAPEAPATPSSRKKTSKRHPGESSKAPQAKKPHNAGLPKGGPSANATPPSPHEQQTPPAPAGSTPSPTDPTNQTQQAEEEIARIPASPEISLATGMDGGEADAEEVFNQDAPQDPPIS